MPYTPTTWVEGVTTLGPTNMNHIEGGLQTADANATTGVNNAATAQTTANNAIPKSTASGTGDLLVSSAPSTITRLAVGSNTQVLTVVSGVPAWATPAAGFAGPGAPVTSLPGSPSNTQQAILVDSTSTPTYSWLLQWDSTQSRWMFLGGSPVIKRVETAETTTSATFADLTTVGPSFTVPRAGVYACVIGSHVANNTNGQDAFIGLRMGSTAATDLARESNFTTGNANMASVATAVQTAVVSASDVLKVQYRVSANTGQFQNRSLQVIPVYLT